MYGTFFQTKKIQQEMIYVVGGPGSGKGTQCKILETKLGYKHISTGDLVRDLLKNEQKDPELKKMTDSVQKGELINADIILHLLKKEMQKFPHVKGFLLDGYPRVMENLQPFEKRVKPYDKVLYFNVSPEIMKARALARGVIEKRTDDNELTISNRIKIYNEQTLPVINYLKTNKNTFFEMDASNDMDVVTQSAISALTTKLTASSHQRSGI